MNQEWNSDFNLASANINNAAASFDGDLNADQVKYIAKDGHDIDTLSSNDYCTKMTDAQVDATAEAVFHDEDTDTDNYVVINQESQTGSITYNYGKKAFCGIMGASSSGQTNGTTVQNWTDAMKMMFDRLCRWVGSSDRRLR